MLSDRAQACYKVFRKSVIDRITLTCDRYGFVPGASGRSILAPWPQTLETRSFARVVIASSPASAAA